MRRSLLSLAAASACLLATAGVATAGEEAQAPRPIQITAAPTILPKGVRCRVVLRSGRRPNGEDVVRSYEGTIARASDGGLALLARTEESAMRVGGARGVPIVGRLVSSTAVRLKRFEEPREIWIAAKDIDSVTVHRAADVAAK